MLQGMSELIFDVTIDEDGRLLAEGRGDSIFTDGADWEDLKANVQEVVEAFYFDQPKPSIVRLHMVRDEVLLAA
jgi:hypothetical protein